MFSSSPKEEEEDVLQASAAMPYLACDIIGLAAMLVLELEANCLQYERCIAAYTALFITLADVITDVNVSCLG